MRLHGHFFLILADHVVFLKAYLFGIFKDDLKSSSGNVLHGTHACYK